MDKVLVDVHRLRGNKFNGLYHFCYQLALHLASNQPDDMRLSLYVPKDAVGMFGNHIRYDTQRSHDKIYMPGTSRYAVWHIATTLSWYRSFSPKTKSIFTIHDLNFLEQKEATLMSRRRYLRLIQQRVNRADHLTFISAFARKQASQHLQLDGKPYDIIYNGCNVPVSSKDVIPHYMPRVPFIFSIGQLHSRKNFHVLPALLRGNDFELVIAGMKDFDYVQEIIAAAKQFDVLDRVKLIGPVSDAEKSWYYKHCKAFVFPSLNEGFGLPVLEAMHFGKPVFLSNLASLPELGGDAAYYFDHFDPEYMQQKFMEGLEHYEQVQPVECIKGRAHAFSWETSAHKYLSLYRSLLNA